MTRYRSVLQFPYSFNVQQCRLFFALPKPSALPPLCPPPYIENPATVHVARKLFLLFLLRMRRIADIPPCFCCGSAHVGTSGKSPDSRLRYPNVCVFATDSNEIRRILGYIIGII